MTFWMLEVRKRVAGSIETPPVLEMSNKVAGGIENSDKLYPFCLEFSNGQFGKITAIINRVVHIGTRRRFLE